QREGCPGPAHVAAWYPAGPVLTRADPGGVGGIGMGPRPHPTLSQRERGGGWGGLGDGGDGLGALGWAERGGDGWQAHQQRLVVVGGDPAMAVGLAAEAAVQHDLL